MKNINIPFIIALVLLITVWVLLALAVNIANASTCSKDFLVMWIENAK